MNVRTCVTHLWMSSNNEKKKKRESFDGSYVSTAANHIVWNWESRKSMHSTGPFISIFRDVLWRYANWQCYSFQSKRDSLSPNKNSASSHSKPVYLSQKKIFWSWQPNHLVDYWLPLYGQKNKQTNWNISKYLFMFHKRKKSNTFGKTWRWANDDTFFLNVFRCYKDLRRMGILPYLKN